jgi:hypothetical protein
MDRVRFPALVPMANVKKGQTVASPQWWKHLRDWKRVFWKRQRNEEKKAAKEEVRRG